MIELSALGQTEKSGCSTGRSALPSGTDLVCQAGQVRFVPKADPAACSNIYNLTGSFMEMVAPPRV
jgi:hypothetical protein